MRRFTTVVIVAVLAAAACAEPTSPVAPSAAPSPIATARTAAAPTTTTAPARAVAVRPAAEVSLPVALVRDDGALAAVSATAGEPLWRLPGAVAAGNGAAAYRTEPDAAGTALVRYDTHRGSSTQARPLDAAGTWLVAVVSHDGRYVVLTDGRVDATHRRTTTRLAVVDVERDDDARILERPGTLEPEAVSVSGQQVFVLDHRDGYYRVRTIELTTGEMWDTVDRNKALQPEDMHGEPVNAAHSPDGRLLATLYRVDGHEDHGPFVHVLNLERTWSYCADLPPGRYDSIASAPDGRTLAVGAADGSWVEIDLRGIDEPSDQPLGLHVRRDVPPPVPLGSRGSVSTGTASVTADAAGVTWWSSTGTPAAHVDRVVDRLVALAG